MTTDARQLEFDWSMLAPPLEQQAKPTKQETKPTKQETTDGQPIIKKPKTTRIKYDFTGREIGSFKISIKATGTKRTRWIATCINCGNETTISTTSLKKETCCCRSEKCYLTRATEKFWSRVDKSTNPNGCWEWTGGTNSDGYGVFSLYIKGKQQQHVSAHKYAWTITNGPVPSDKILLHSCDNPRCCNPKHLRVGTHKENVEDMTRRDRHGQTRTRLSAEQISAMRLEYTDTDTVVSQNDLAIKYKVNRRTVRRHLQGLGGKGSYQKRIKEQRERGNDKSINNPSALGMGNHSLDQEDREPNVEHRLSRNGADSCVQEPDSKSLQGS